MADTAAALANLRTQCWHRWPTAPSAPAAELDQLLQALLDAAADAKPQTLLIMNPTSRQRQLQLAVICDDRSLADMYHQEWAELAVSSHGALYLIYRRRDGEDYGVKWDSGVTLPATLHIKLPEPLAIALIDQPS